MACAITSMSTFPNYVFALALLLTASATPGNAYSPGGSTLGVHDFPTGYVGPDNIHTWDPPTGTVLNYHIASVRSVVDNQLQLMYNEGQRRARLFLWFKSDAPNMPPIGAGKTVLRSSGGNFSPQVQANIVALITTLRNMGYEEILVAFGGVGYDYIGPWGDRNSSVTPHDYDVDGIYSSSFTRPPGCNASSYPPDASYTLVDSLPDTDPCHELWRGSVSSWSSRNEDLFQESWNVIYNIYPLVTSVSGITVKVDLGNEYSVDLTGETSHYDSGHDQQIAYHLTWGKRAEFMRRLWANFVIVYGKAQTVGFSTGICDMKNEPSTGTFVPCSMAATVNGARQVYDAYGYGTPYLYEVHLYDKVHINNPAGHQVGMTAKEQLDSFDSALTAKGDGAGLVIGESYYNDATTASSVATFSARTLYYLIQWPLVRNTVSPYSDYHIDVNGGLYSFANYKSHGF
jgi:hypothetical protein